MGGAIPPLGAGIADCPQSRLRWVSSQRRRQLAREARRIEREQSRRAYEKARARYEGLTKAELSDLLAERGLPKTGNVDDLIERLVVADGK